MKIIAVAVVSINGKITKGAGPDIGSWTSPEDKKFLSHITKRAKLIVMGRGTYEAARAKIRPTPQTLRIILTSHPEKFKNQRLPGQLEFSDETPHQLLKRLGHYKELLLLGGSKLYSDFFKRGLVDELYLTIEPLAFGHGKSLIADTHLEVDLQLVSLKKLNKSGTLLLHYKVLR